MSSSAEKLFDEAMALSASERRRLAEHLLDAARPDPSEVVDAAWDDEVRRRVEAAEKTGEPGLDWNEASASLRAKYSRK